MRGFADNVGRKTERNIRMVYIRIEGINKEYKRNGHGRMFRGIVDGDRCVFLETDKVDDEEVNEIDRKELLKLGDWLESQAPSKTDEIKEAQAFDIGRLYMYIMLKARADIDFFEWWSSYKFNIAKYEYDYRNKYITIRTGTGTLKS